MINSKQKTILLVEDDAIIALTHSRLLSNEGYIIVHAPSGEEAVKIMDNESNYINLIIMDIDLGSGIDGTEAAEIILKNHNVPLLFLSSHIEKEIVEKTEKITSYGYVVKNSSFTVLDASIKMAFKLFEAKLHTEDQKEHLSTILQSIGDAVIATDLEGNIIQMNPISEQLTGWTFGDAEGKALTLVFKIINSITRNLVTNPVELVLENGKVVGLANHTILIAKDGTEHQIADSASPIRDAKGNITGVVLVFRDVTKEYEVQRKIIKSEKRALALFEASQVPKAVNDGNQNITYLNSAFVKTFGYTLEDIPTLADWWPKAYPDPTYRNWVSETWTTRLEKAAIENKPFEPLELSIRCKNDEIKTVLASATTLGESFESEHLVTLFDITQSKQAEETIRLNVKLLEASQSFAKLGGWELDLVTGKLFWTAETYRIHDTSPLEFNPTVDAGVGYFLPESKRIISEALNLAIEKGIGYNLELETYTTKGRRIDVRTTCEVTMHNGKATKLTGIFQDITKQKELDNDLINLVKEKDFTKKHLLHLDFY